MAAGQETRYSISSIEVLRGLEPVRVRAPLIAGYANPVLHNADDVETLMAVLLFEDTLLLSFKHYKVRLAVIMRRLKRYKASLEGRAALIMQAVAALARDALPVCLDTYQRCQCFLMLTSQHDDAMRACPAAGLSRI